MQYMRWKGCQPHTFLALLVPPPPPPPTHTPHHHTRTASVLPLLPQPRSRSGACAHHKLLLHWAVLLDPFHSLLHNGAVLNLGGGGGRGGQQHGGRKNRAVLNLERWAGWAADIMGGRTAGRSTRRWQATSLDGTRGFCGPCTHTSHHHHPPTPPAHSRQRIQSNIATPKAPTHLPPNPNPTVTGCYAPVPYAGYA